MSVVANNSAGSSAPIASLATAVVIGTPQNTGVLPSITGTPSVGQSVSASAGSWAGSPSSYTFTWYDGCNSSGASCNSTPVQIVTPVSGGSTSTYTLQTADEGGYIAVYVYATNSLGSSVSVESGNYPGPVQGAPVNTSAPVISGTVAVGDQLTTNSGAWSGYPASTPTYQWEDCDAAGSNCFNASGTGSATSTYKVSSADTNYSLKVRVSETNSSGTGYAYTSASTCGTVGGIADGFGNGSNGVVSLNSALTLTQDICATTFTSNGYAVNTNGWRILATQSITINDGSTVSDNGSNSGSGAGANAGSVGGGASGGEGAVGENAYPGSPSSSSSALGGAGGTAGSACTSSAAGSSPWNNSSSTPYGNTNLLVGGGGGGGGGSTFTSGYFGGTGGGGAGIIALAAPSIVFQGSPMLQASGAAGFAGNGNSTHTNCGSGGGGGGAALLFGSVSGSYSSSFGGGSGGAYSNAGNAGGSGGSGVGVIGGSSPTVASVSPSSLARGVSNQNVTITGTNYASEATVVFSNPNIIVNSVTYNSATSLTANITVNAGASAGACSVTVDNYTGAGTGTGAFSVS